MVLLEDLITFELQFAETQDLTVMHRPEDNGLDFNFEHQTAAIDRKTLEYFYYYLCKIMFKGIERPHLTIEEILKLI